MLQWFQFKEPLPNKIKRIVIVDDNRDSADTLAMLIQTEGHSVFVAYDAQTGLRLAQESSPHIIFHDIAMPGIDGYAAARRLRSEERIKSTLLVAVTAHDRTSDRRSALLAGFDLHLTKPVEFDEIKLILNNPNNLRH